MKKFLSLVLALAMTLSLVTISAGAKDFTDSDELSGVVYEEAVNVMSEMEIIDGYADGDFRPQGTLTRGAAAKIIACMMLGKTTAEALGTQAAPFKDVPVGSTFAGYIAYCVEAGLIDGYADGTFRPSGTLTGFAFLKMLLTALGYDSSIEGYTGTNWTVNVASRATQIGLTDGNDEFVGTRAATREEACLYAVNTLKATLVEYENKGQEITVSDGTVINVRPSAPTYVTSNIAGAATSIDDTYDNTRQDYTVEFAEKYQPDLELDGTTDVFGRPAHIWTWKNDEIGTYVDYDKLVAEYTTKVTGRDLYDALGKSALDACKDRVYIYVDGETDGDILGNAYFTENQITRSYTDTVGETGNGVLTQVFHDTRADEITIAVINTYLAKADEDYDDKNDDVDLTVYEIQKDGRVYMKTEDQKETMSVEGEDFAIEDVTEDQLFLVTVADGEIQTMADPEILSETTLVNFRLGKYVTADTQYDYADTAMYDEEVLDMYDDANMKDVTYNVILDEYGYMIGIELNQDPDQYLFLTGIDLGSSNLSKRNADANVIFMSGEMDTITVDMRDSLMTYENPITGKVMTDNLSALTAPTIGKDGKASTTRAQLNTWCTYTVDANGVYTLEQVAPKTVAKADGVAAIKVAQSVDNVGAGDPAMTIDQRNVSLSGYGSSRVYGNDDSVYLTVDPDTDMDTILDRNSNNVRIIDDVSSVVTGVKNVKLTVNNLPTKTVDRIDYYAPANEVYTLYKDDGYVIAAVVLGEDEGITTNYAYITSSDVNREAYASDEWTWTREAVVNGKIVELTEVGTSLRELGTGASNGNMQRGDWFEIKYDADGNVRKAELVDFYADADGSDDGINVSEDEFAASVYELNQKVGTTNKNLMETHDTVILSDLGDQAGTAYDITKLTFKNGTLYVDDNATLGFAVSANVNVVLALAGKADRNGNYDIFDDVDDSYTGYSGLEKAIRDMNKDGSFAAGTVEIHAVIENGAATSIIINDKNPAGTLVGPTPSSEMNYAQFGAWNTIDVYAYAVTDPTSTVVRDQAVSFLQNMGYTVNGSVQTASGWRIYASAYGSGYTFNTALNTMYKITAPDGAVYYRVATATLSLTGLDGKYLSDVTANTAGAYVDTDADTITSRAASYTVVAPSTGFDITLTDDLYKVVIDGVSNTYYKDGARVDCNFPGSWVADDTTGENLPLVEGDLIVNGKDIDVTTPADGKIKVTIMHVDGTSDVVLANEGDQLDNSDGLEHYFTVGAPKDGSQFFAASADKYTVTGEDVTLYDGFRKVDLPDSPIANMGNTTVDCSGEDLYTAVGGQKYAAINSDITAVVTTDSVGFTPSSGNVVLTASTTGSATVEGEVTTDYVAGDSTQPVVANSTTSTVTFLNGVAYGGGAVTFTFTMATADETLTISTI